MVRACGDPFIWVVLLPCECQVIRPPNGGKQGPSHISRARWGYGCLQFLVLTGSKSAIAVDRTNCNLM